MGWNHRKGKMDPTVYPYAIMVLLTIMAMGFVLLKRRSTIGENSRGDRHFQESRGASKKKRQHNQKRRDTRKVAAAATTE